jgi:hypothetical protein
LKSIGKEVILGDLHIEKVVTLEKNSLTEIRPIQLNLGGFV